MVSIKFWKIVLPSFTDTSIKLLRTLFQSPISTHIKTQTSDQLWPFFLFSSSVSNHCPGVKTTEKVHLKAPKVNKVFDGWYCCWQSRSLLQYSSSSLHFSLIFSLVLRRTFHFHYAHWYGMDYQSTDKTYRFFQDSTSWKINF